MNAAVTHEEHAALSDAMHEAAFDRRARNQAVEADEFSALTEDQALADLDTFSDWLASHCMHQHEVTSHGIHCQVRMPGEPFDLGLYQLKLDSATTAQLVHIRLECLDPQRVYLAVQEEKRRYLRAKGFNA